MSTITFKGNLADDPQLTYIPSGAAVVELVVIENQPTKNEDGSWEDGVPNRFEVKAWRGLAENVAASIAKGTNVTITGRIKTEKWTDKDSGENRSKQIVVADDIAVSLKYQTATVSKAARAADE